MGLSGGLLSSSLWRPGGSMEMTSCGYRGGCGGAAVDDVMDVSFGCVLLLDTR